MENKIKKRLWTTTILFWTLLLYIIAALIWWFIELERQNKEMYLYKVEQLQGTNLQTRDAAEYARQMQKIQKDYKRNSFKFGSEGIVFLGLILLVAVFISRSLRQQLFMQQQQQNFMMAVTHELKTPIAVAKLNLETIIKRKLDEQRQEKLLQATLAETKRLDLLTNNILLSSQLESVNFKINKEDLDFSHLLADRISEFRLRYPERPFDMQLQEDADIAGDPLLLQILVNNLLENAVKYTDKQTPITVKLEKTADKVIMQVIDEGPGIPDSERKKIFSKFYRIGNESTRKKPGTGLGLYLCRKIAADHNADISMTHHRPTGSIFTVTFHSQYQV
ncbi:MAG: ATP-binding protein [Niabella sp.]